MSNSYSKKHYTYIVLAGKVRAWEQSTRACIMQCINGHPPWPKFPWVLQFMLGKGENRWQTTKKKVWSSPPSTEILRKKLTTTRKTAHQCWYYLTKTANFTMTCCIWHVKWYAVIKMNMKWLSHLGLLKYKFSGTRLGWMFFSFSIFIWKFYKCSTWFSVWYMPVNIYASIAIL